MIERIALRVAAVIAALALVVLGLGACSSAPPTGVVLWHAYNGPERTALETLTATWNARHPELPITLVAVPYDAFADKITSAVPNGNGPDLFIYSHDRIGAWAAAGVIEPIEFWVDDDLAIKYQPAALSAMAYRGSLWGLPLAVKSLALFYRTDRGAPPKTTDELFARIPAAKARGGYVIAYENNSLYGQAPWLFGFGGQVLDDDGAVHIASAEAAAALGFARKLVTTGATPAETSGPLIATLFNEGKVDMVLGGPWFLGDIGKDVPWAVTTLPIVSETGRAAAPFLGAEGVLMSARARDKDAAFAVMQFLASDESAILRAKDARQVVASEAAYREPSIANDQVLRAFRAQLEHTVAMPASPLMRTVWTPYKTALEKVLGGNAEPGAALVDVEGEVKRYAEAP